jgi:hypothetical protein
LGEVILAGSSYASLRDLADLGATLMFDDAEQVADPKAQDQDKRNLLLAGNRKGACVAVKEIGPDSKSWSIRYVNAYCPRIFTAIRPPDPVLSSRSIIVPLLRTDDPHKANSDVLDYELWPTDRRDLVDDLWSLALAYQRKVAPHFRQVSEMALSFGRAFEPWKGVLGVAHWLESEGMTGIFQRMVDLFRAYQKEMTLADIPDLPKLVVASLIELVENLRQAKGSNPVESFTFTVSQLHKYLDVVAEREDLKDGTSEVVGTRLLGRILNSLRIKSERTPRARQRICHIAEVEHLARVYGLEVSWENANTAKEEEKSKERRVYCYICKGEAKYLPGQEDKRGRPRYACDRCEVLWWRI